MAVDGVLHQHAHLPLRQPVRMHRLHRFPGGRVAVDLAALHRQHPLAGALVPHDQLEAGLEHLVHEVGIDRHRRARAGGAERDLARQRILERPGLGGVPDHGDAGRLRHAADPVELRRFVAHLRIAELRLQRDALRHRRDHAAVARRHCEQVIGGEHAAGARHVDRNDARRARDVLADVLRDEAGVDVVRAAGRIADDHADGRPGVEGRDVLRRRGAARAENGDCNRSYDLQRRPLARRPMDRKLTPDQSVMSRGLAPVRRAAALHAGAGEGKHFP